VKTSGKIRRKFMGRYKWGQKIKHIYMELKIKCSMHGMPYLLHFCEIWKICNKKEKRIPVGRYK
jgi:hypothetical protein